MVLGERLFPYFRDLSECVYQLVLGEYLFLYFRDLSECDPLLFELSASH